MTIRFDTPQDTEDAYYDALEAGNLEDLLGCWEASDDVACLLPMQNLARGPDQVRLRRLRQLRRPQPSLSFPRRPRLGRA